MVKTSNDDGLYDLVTGSHYAGCRCTLTKHPLEKCEGFATCLKSCLQSIKEKCPDNFIKGLTFVENGCIYNIGNISSNPWLL